MKVDNMSPPSVARRKARPTSKRHIFLPDQLHEKVAFLDLPVLGTVLTVFAQEHQFMLVSTLAHCPRSFTYRDMQILLSTRLKALSYEKVVKSSNGPVGWSTHPRCTRVASKERRDNATVERRPEAVEWAPLV